jgi:hypothetical protein
MRIAIIALAILAASAGTIAATHAAQLDCVMVGYESPGTHEKSYLKIAPSAPIDPANPFSKYILPPPPLGFAPLKCVRDLLRGPIVEGDYEKVARAIRESWPNLTMIDLDSPGGSVREALKIGRMLRKYLITTNVSRLESAELPPPPPGFGPVTPIQREACASACALIWFGGVERSGMVGLHRPRITDPDFASASPEEATKRYRLLLSAIEAYLTEMETPRPIIDQMLATGSSEIRWIDAVSEGLSQPPSFAEWEAATCPASSEIAPWVCRASLRSRSVRNLSPP